jgi:hypothetical protein
MHWRLKDSERSPPSASAQRPISDTRVEPATVLAMPDDDPLLIWIHLFFSLECEACGRFELFDEAHRETESLGGGEVWAWEFAKHAVGYARRDGWIVEHDAKGAEHYYCGQCRPAVKD